MLAAGGARCQTAFVVGNFPTLRSGSGEVTPPDRGSLRPPAPVRCSARKLAARSLPGRPPAYVLNRAHTAVLASNVWPKHFGSDVLRLYAVYRRREAPIMRGVAAGRSAQRG